MSSPAVAACGELKSADIEKKVKKNLENPEKSSIFVVENNRI